MTSPVHLPRSLLLQWHVTERCNLRCAHCYQDGKHQPELPMDALRSILDQFIALLTDLRHRATPSRIPAHITLTGGEPFVRKDFFDLLETISRHRNRFTFAVLCNGTFIDSSNARALATLRPRFVQVSIEGTETTHDRIRGPGTYHRAVAAIRLLRESKIPTLISFTAHKGNYREFPEVARLGEKLGATRVWADRFIPAGHGNESRDLMLTPAETLEFIQLMHVSKTSVSGCEVAMHRALQFLVAGGAPYHCTAGDSLITVLSDGTLCPCRRMPIPVGNILEKPLQSLYQESDLFQQLRAPVPTAAGCESCCYASLCRGGLRCLSQAVHSTPFKADPGCWNANKS